MRALLPELSLPLLDCPAGIARGDAIWQPLELFGDATLHGKAVLFSSETVRPSMGNRAGLG